MILAEILNEAGFQTIEGMAAVKQAIQDVADTGTPPLCSGYKVFPDGSVCLGCPDCASQEK